MNTTAIHNEACRARHLGAWAIEPGYLRNAIAAIKSGLWPMRAATPPVPQRENVKQDVGYQMVAGNVAVVHLTDALMKGDSKFGGTNTVRARQALRSAVASATVASVMLYVDSPGGAVAGTDELAQDVAAAAKTKPVHAYVDDMCASAALWVASQANKITSNRSALIGSIGVLSVIEDSSRAADMAGVEVHVIASSGAEAFKGAGVPGSKVTGEQLAYIKSLIDETAALFIKTVAAGRGMTEGAVRKVADGRVMHAKDAKRAGLIDDIATFDTALSMLRLDTISGGSRPAHRTAKAVLADLARLERN